MNIVSATRAPFGSIIMINIIIMIIMEMASRLGNKGIMFVQKVHYLQWQRNELHFIFEESGTKLAQLKFIFRFTIKIVHKRCHWRLNHNNIKI